MTGAQDRSPEYRAGSLSLAGAVALGTGVMIGAGIFALTGQVAELAGEWFPWAFVVAAVVAGFSAHSYVKMASAHPSAGGIAMFLEKAYGKGLMTGACALLMYFSMVINESLVARTFGTYALQLFDAGGESWQVSVLGVILLFVAFLVNLSSKRFIERLSFVMAFAKIVGVAVFAVAGLWVSRLSFQSVSIQPEATSGGGFVAAVALALLAYKGFTTITNSGAEIVDPRRNVGRAIVIAIGLCLVLYLLVALAIGANLGIDRIVAARDYALAEAAGPAFGGYGLWFTVIFALLATVSGAIASVFAVSRMLAMLTQMRLVPNRHFGMPGSIQRHTLVYTIVIAMALTLAFDLSRIAVLGAVFNIVMDIAIHWGVLRHLRKEVHARAWILNAAIGLDVVILAALMAVKTQSDPVIAGLALLGLGLVFAGEALFLRLRGSAAA